MPKMRVYQLAKELQVQSALVLELLDRLGQEVKSDLSVLEQNVADLVRERVTTAIAAERKRLAQERREAEEQAAKEPIATSVEAESDDTAPPAEPKPGEPATETPAVTEPEAERPTSILFCCSSTKY